jgi:hypothetical protein
MRIGILGLAALALLALPPAGCGGGGGTFSTAPGPVNLPAIEQFADEGRQHIDPSVTPVYRTDPPTSGPHYPTPTLPGFYAEAQRPGHLVHALEHGNIVIYYDPARVPATDLDGLRVLAGRYTDPFDGVVVTPRTDAEHPVIATAWRVMLRLSRYDQRQLDSFLELFRGRGPEDPVR